MVDLNLLLLPYIGDTPRRSARLSEKFKATESPVSETPKKKQKSTSKKGAKEKSDAETVDENEGMVGEVKESAEVAPDAKDAGEHDDGEEVTGEALPDKDNNKEADAEMVTDEQGPHEQKKDAEPKGEDNVDKNMDEGENQEGNKPPAEKDEDAENKELPSKGLEDYNKETESTLSGAAPAPLESPMPSENPSV